MRYVPAAEFDWIRERLADPFSGATAFVPGGYEAYVRLFHPAQSDHGGEPSLSWAEIAEQHGRVMHAGAQFHAIATPAGRAVVNDVNELDGPPPGRYRPTWGNLPEPEFGTLVDLLRQSPPPPMTPSAPCGRATAGCPTRRISSAPSYPSAAF